MPQVKITAINFTPPNDRVMAPHAENSKDKDAATETKSNLGTLSALPAELIAMVLRELNLASLAAFRDMNKSAREMVDAATKFKEVKDYAPFVLQAAISLNPPLPTTVAILYDTLINNTCSSCEIRDGSILFLLDCRRYCKICFCWNDDQDQYLVCGGGPGIWDL